MENIDTNVDYRVVVGSALRYMIGRGSYGVGCVIDFITQNINTFDNKNYLVMARDIKEYIDEHPNCYDKDDWLKLRYLLLNKVK